MIAPGADYFHRQSGEISINQRSTTVLSPCLYPDNVVALKTDGIPVVQELSHYYARRKSLSYTQTGEIPVTQRDTVSRFYIHVIVHYTTDVFISESVID